MSNMQDEMMGHYQEVIRKNLPQAVGEELQKVLEEASRNSAKVSDLETTIGNLKSDKLELLQNIQQLQQQLGDIVSREAQVAKREMEVSRREQNQEVEMLKKDLQCANTVSDKIFKLTETMCKNTIFKEQVFGSAPVVFPAYNGCAPYSGSAPFSSMSEKTAE